MVKDLKIFRESAAKYLLSYLVMFVSVVVPMTISIVRGPEEIRSMQSTLSIITGVIGLVAVALQYLGVKGIKESVADEDVPSADFMVYSVYAGIACQVLSLVSVAVTAMPITILGSLASVASYALMIVAFAKFSKSATFPSPEGAKQGMIGYIIASVSYVLIASVIGMCLGLPALVVGFVFILLGWLKLKNAEDAPSSPMM